MNSILKNDKYNLMEFLPSTNFQYIDNLFLLFDNLFQKIALSGSLILLGNF